ncbi:MAG: DUF1343 domain-containing protein [Candidatus Marinimicrobia bacterium]|nr:DUF1343 domain-containing protein [Candidatus Neomarinimicrobiota bacterium]
MRILQKISYLLISLIGLTQAKTGVDCGLDGVIKNDFVEFSGKNVGLVCNHTSLDQSGNHIIDLFFEKANLKVVFAPEHGLRGDEAAGGHINDGIDDRTGVPIVSLYGKTRKPTPEMLRNLDVLVYDIQDVGVRFYTYISTMAYCMEAAAENNIPFVVLDRPNPVRGDMVEGGILEKGFNSFVGMHEVPVRYGLTAGEYAQLINGEGYLRDGIRVQLSVVKMKGWQRHHWYDETGLTWVAPSPNIPNLETAIVYPGMCLLEGTNLSEGRGTETPFLLFGAPWLDSQKICSLMDNTKGVAFTCTTFTPREIKGKATNPKFRDEPCQGILMKVTDRNDYRPVETTVLLLQKIAEIHPKEFQWNEPWIDKLSGNSDLRKSIDEKNVKQLLSLWRLANERFIDMAQKYFLY